MIGFRKLAHKALNVLLALFIISAQLFAPLGALIPKAAAVPVCEVDTAGANDEPGQKDLTQLCVDDTGGLTLSLNWNWDELDTSGNNSLDACALFDTDNDGNVNRSVCVTTKEDPAVLNVLTIYTCGDDKVDRCTSPTNVLAGPYATTCSVDQDNTDPFPAGAGFPDDTVATCIINRIEAGGANTKLVDVCSYPSQQPNSDPSDCVVIADLSGKLEVRKTLVPANDPGLFNLQIDGNTEAPNVSNGGTTGEVVVPASRQGTTHSVGETAGTNTSLAGYSINIVCRSLNNTGPIVASGTAATLNVSVVDGDDIVCVITNTAAASITIVKNAIPNDAQDFAFTATGTGTSNFSLDDDADNTLPSSRPFNNLAAGTYTFTEASTSGWYLDAIDCPNITETQDLTGRTVSLTVTAGQNITCTFTNRKLGQVIVTKQTLPDGDPTQFSITASPAAGVVSPTPIQPISDNQSVTYSVKHGTYNVTEAAVSGWSKDDSQCQNLVIDGNTAQVNGIPTRSCTITNTKLATLTIIKDALPNHEQNFSFSTSGLGGAVFNLDDDADNTLSNQQVFNNLTPGQQYSVTEQATPGWQLTGLTCNNTPQQGNTATVTPGAGQSVTCTFTNTKLVSVSGTKFEVDAGASNGGLGTVLSGWTIFIDSNNNGVLDQGEQSDVTDANGDYSFENLLYGTTVVLREVLQSGWTQIFGPSSFTLDTANNVADKDFGNFENASISGFKWNDKNANDVVDQGEEKLNGWTITLYNDGPDQDTDVDDVVTSTVTANGGLYSFTNLSPGAYAVCETPQAGWIQTFPNGNGCHAITINVSGEVEEANFGNQGRGTIRVIKNVDSDGDGDIDFSDVTNWNWNINANGNFTTGSANAQPVAAGTYTVSEVQKPNFHVVSMVCDRQVNSAVESAQVVVAPGANITCTFVNARDRGILRLIKDVTNDNNGSATAADFNLHVTQSGSDVAGSPAAGSAVGTVYTLPTGTYTVSEDTPPTGYEQTSIVCDSQTTNSVALTTDTEKVCTIFNNDKAPTLTLVKQLVNDNSGTASANDFTLTADPIVGSNISGTSGVNGNANASTPYTLTESSVAGYHVKTDWTCDSGTFDAQANTITLALDQDVTCTIVNDDDAHPGIALTKTGPAAAHEGDNVVYTFTVDNTGDEPLSNVVINDPLIDNITYVSGDTDNDSVLDVNETWTFTANYLIPANQIADVYNQATVCADPRVGDEVCEDDDHTIDVLHPSITVEKDGPALAYEGQIVGYTFLVTNTGDTTLFNVGIADNIATNESCLANTLAPAASTTCTAIYLILIPTTANVINTVIASGTDILNRTVTNTDNHTLDVIHPSINVIKTGPATAHEGDQITYTFTVTNTGDTPLSSNTVNDNVAGGAVYQSGDTNNDAKLDTTETWIFTKQYTIPTPQVADVVNTATACGFDPIQAANPQQAGQPVCDSDTHTLDVLHPGINVVKTGPATGQIGDNVTYTFTVTNTGDTPLSSVEVSDNIAGDATYVSGDTDVDTELDLTETWTFSVDYQIIGNEGDPFINTATVCALDALRQEACDEDTHTLDVPEPVLLLAKSNNRPNATVVGDTVTYTLTVTVPEDSGKVFDVTVTDLPPAGFVYVPGSETATKGSLTKVYASPGIWSLGDLSPGEVVVLTYKAVIQNSATPGTYPDIAFAEGCDLPTEDDCEGVVLSNVSAGADTPFVATRVAIKAPQVLAASTTVLVNTGAADIWRNLMVGTLLLGAALATLVSRQKKGGRT